MRVLKDTISILRPHHWIKNILVVFPLLFGGKFSQPEAIVKSITVLVLFNLCASVVYIINDIHDRAGDLNHPLKKLRPLASGSISPRYAFFVAGVLLIACGLISTMVNVLASVVVLCYLLLQIFYTFVLKHHMLADVIAIAIGFVLRPVAGAFAIGVQVSPWLVICTFTLCLFMGFCKRYNEAVMLHGVHPAGEHRKTLIGYTPELLTHLITLSGAVAVVSFVQYSVSARTVGIFGTHYLAYTLPLVVYAIFRFAMLSMAARRKDPVDIIIHDWPLQVSFILWVACAVVIILFGRDIQSFLSRF